MKLNELGKTADVYDFQSRRACGRKINPALANHIQLIRPRVG